MPVVVLSIPVISSCHYLSVVPAVYSSIIYIYEVYVWLILLWGCRGVYTSWVSDYALNGTEVG